MFQFTDRQIQIPENKRKKSEISSLLNELTMDQKISLCVEILEKNPEYRRPEDLQIIQAFTSKNKFLKQIQEEEGEGTLRECYKRMLIEFYDENQVVLEQGERAHQFFIILSGNVSVYVYRDPKVEVREEDLDKATLIKKRSFNTNKLISGESFGEMALLNDNLRSASIICDSKCIFGVLSKKDYKEILQKAHENRVNQQLKEFHGCMKQYNVSTKLLDILFTAFQSFHYQFRQTVYFQGQQSKQEVYLIKSGEFLITECNDNLSSPKKCVSSVALLQKGQFFGDHECFQNIEKRQQNVICNSENGVVLKIQLSSLIQRLQSTNQMHLYDQLRNACLQREQVRLERKSRQLTQDDNYFIDMKYVKQRNLTYQVKSVRSAKRNTFSIRSPLQIAQDVIRNKKQVYLQLYKEEDYRPQTQQRLTNSFRPNIQQLRRQTWEQFLINDQKYIN